jgi:hypothetical protein
MIKFEKYITKKKKKYFIEEELEREIKWKCQKNIILKFQLFLKTWLIFVITHVFFISLFFILHSS